MNKCIYMLKKYPELNFTKEEHIFPKGIGGVTVLPKGIVSDEANHGFSPMELNFMRNSIISIPRIFHGPGKRGKQSLNIKKQTHSKISLMEDLKTKEVSLGYIAKGKPYSIFQIRGNNINSNIKIESTFSKIDKEIIKDLFETFKKIYKKSNKKFLIDQRIHKNSFILGMDNKNQLYLAINSNSSKMTVEKIIGQLDFKTNGIIGGEKITESPKVNLNLNFNQTEFSRVLFKIAYNVLAHEVGIDFITQNRFHELRNFILNGSKKEKFNMKVIDENNKSLDFLNLNHGKHAVIITTFNNMLAGYIFIYGFKFLLNFGIKLNDNISITGRICCWEERKEYSIIEYISKG